MPKPSVEAAMSDDTDKLALERRRQDMSNVTPELEKVAVALWRADETGCDWDDHDEEEQAYYHRLARAALLAIREPTERMVSAARARMLVRSCACYDLDGKRVDVAPGSIPDGIDSRDETIKQLDAQVARLREMTEWRPIETAPKDGTWIFVIASKSAIHPSIARWNDGHGWGDELTPTFFIPEHEPDHWLPVLPPPPGDKT